MDVCVVPPGHVLQFLRAAMGEEFTQDQLAPLQQVSIMDPMLGSMLHHEIERLQREMQVEPPVSHPHLLLWYPFELRALIAGLGGGDVESST